MRPLLFLPALAALALAGCDGGSPPVRGEGSWDSPVPVGTASPTVPQILPTPGPLPAAPETADVVIVDSSGRDSRRIAGDGLLPLARILEIAQARVPGQIIEVELDEDDDDGPEYELEILTADGLSIDMKIDARRGVILGLEED